MCRETALQAIDMDSSDIITKNRLADDIDISGRSLVAAEETFGSFEGASGMWIFI